MRVIHVAFRGNVAFVARNLESEEEAVIVTERLPGWYFSYPRLRKMAWPKPKRGGRW